ncbi:anthocyanidin 3-O-galactosyltransferase F3GT1-like [Cornus florida]|uniref:anthocyanidin 3-O-galactosyltransferase F3GT1-like n=1 Tax=Cornus florida TaxID=4283 RepID=UPI00289C20BB|nr:anthocyanidin 3-O-galactosyltransferase F3GT1-like [Cornus florida]
MSTVVPKKQHVGVLAFPFASHTGILLVLTRSLAAAAPHVTFSFFSTAKANQSLFSAPMPENIKRYDVFDGVAEGYVFSGKPEEDIELFLKAVPENFRRGMEAAEADMGKRINCLISDAFLWFVGEMAEDMHVSWLPLWFSTPCALSVHVYTDLIRQSVCTSGTDVAGREDEIVTFLPGFPSLRLGDLPNGVVMGNLEAPFSILLYKMAHALPRATAVIINSFEEVDLLHTNDLKSKFQKFLSVGPFNFTSPLPWSNRDEHGCLAWLDKHKAASVAYIGFGTRATPTPKEVGELAEALEASGTPFLWSLGDNMTRHLPEGFLGRTSTGIGKIVAWAPQVQVLEHPSIGVFVSHCGWTLVLESIAGGVPMIGRPVFAEQQLNTWMVENLLQIGVRVEGGVLTKSGTMHALDLILKNEKGKKLREQLGAFKELALKAVGPNGSSTRNFKTLLELVTK